MIRATTDAKAQPHAAGNRIDQAYAGGSGLELAPLLDVDLEETGDVAVDPGFNRINFQIKLGRGFHQAHALGVTQGTQPLRRGQTRGNRTTHGRPAESGPLLGGERDHTEAMIQLAGQLSSGFQSPNHPGSPVVDAALDHGVQMRTDQEVGDPLTEDRHGVTGRIHLNPCPG